MMASHSSPGEHMSSFCLSSDFATCATYQGQKLIKCHRVLCKLGQRVARPDQNKVPTRQGNDLLISRNASKRGLVLDSVREPLVTRAGCRWFGMLT